MTARRNTKLAALLAEIRACRACVTAPLGAPLPHEPRPVLRASRTARIAICGQAPGIRVHNSGIPFTDPSGDRLRDWMGVTSSEFYDETRIAIIPMGFCFPGNDAKGGDLPPRKECAPLWRAKVMAGLPNLDLVLLAGSYALAWHLPGTARQPLTETVRDWRSILDRSVVSPAVLPLPHPSWRNSGWLKANPWFSAELVPELQTRVRAVLG